MHCGPIRYRVDARKEAEKRPFDHYVIPRFTGFRAPFDKEEQDLSIQELYAGMATDEPRNRQIADDVIRAHANGRNVLILTERTAHVALLAGRLREELPDVMSLTGGRGRGETGAVLQRIAETPPDRQLTLVATGRYIGEGFDEPRLDTLFLAMPISWKGTLEQYAGRLHRLFVNKREVQIYDYIDIHVKIVEKMYQKRLARYPGIGYRPKAESVPDAATDIIFDNTNFLPLYQNDVMTATRETVEVMNSVPALLLLAPFGHVATSGRCSNSIADPVRPSYQHVLKVTGNLLIIPDLPETQTGPALVRQACNQIGDNVCSVSRELLRSDYPLCLPEKN